MKGERTSSGKKLNELWGVNAKHALYREDGIFYIPLKEFPGAYFDKNGYVLFETEDDFSGDLDLKIGKKINVPGGISSLTSYVRVTPHFPKVEILVLQKKLKKVLSAKPSLSHKAIQLITELITELNQLSL